MRKDYVDHDHSGNIDQIVDHDNYNLRMARRKSQLYSARQGSPLEHETQPFYNNDNKDGNNDFDHSKDIDN